MKSKKEKRSIKSLNEQTVRKKLVSPKLDIFKPAHTSTEKKYLPLENKMKNQSKTILKIPKNAQLDFNNEHKSIENCTYFMNSSKKINNPILNNVEKNYLRKYDSDYQLESKLNGSQRSTSLGKIGDSGLLLRFQHTKKGDCETLRKDKPKRFQKFAFRSQKYIKLTSEAKTLTDEDYNKKIENLKQDIEYFKDTYLKSIKALMGIDKIIENEKEKFDLQKNYYEQQIKKLKDQKQKRKPLIGHLYSYKQFPIQEVIPSDIIVEKTTELYLEQNKFSYSRKKGQELINKYLDINDENQSVQALGLSRLSVQSK